MLESPGKLARFWKKSFRTPGTEISNNFGFDSKVSEKSSRSRKHAMNKSLRKIIILAKINFRGESVTSQENRKNYSLDFKRDRYLLDDETLLLRFYERMKNKIGIKYCLMRPKILINGAPNGPKK
uniref:Uncharacterized protein n=1 Tax=Romanomermis culicivorax TaxID=13658 RepID=A0A915IZW0_ROMCU